jgi:hypothetical protein
VYDRTAYIGSARLQVHLSAPDIRVSRTFCNGAAPFW